MVTNLAITILLTSLLVPLKSNGSKKVIELYVCLESVANLLTEESSTEILNDLRKATLPLNIVKNGEFDLNKFKDFFIKRSRLDNTKDPLLPILTLVRSIGRGPQDIGHKFGNLYIERLIGNPALMVDKEFKSFYKHSWLQAPTKSHYAFIAYIFENNQELTDVVSRLMAVYFKSFSYKDDPREVAERFARLFYIRKELSPHIGNTPDHLSTKNTRVIKKFLENIHLRVISAIHQELQDQLESLKIEINVFSEQASKISRQLDVLIPTEINEVKNRTGLKYYLEFSNMQVLTLEKKKDLVDARIQAIVKMFDLGESKFLLTRYGKARLLSKYRPKRKPEGADGFDQLERLYSERFELVRQRLTRYTDDPLLSESLLNEKP